MRSAESAVMFVLIERLWYTDFLLDGFLTNRESHDGDWHALSIHIN